MGHVRMWCVEWTGEDGRGGRRVFDSDAQADDFARKLRAKGLGAILWEM